jgi:hypothetical protein
MRVEGRLIDDVRLTTTETIEVIYRFLFSRIQTNMIKEKPNGNFHLFFEVLLSN